LELTILMPCLNEAATVADCVREATAYLNSRGITGEVLIADNGSTDNSRELAVASGARVTTVPEKGYGNALRGGISAAKGRYIIIGDCDGSYDFSDLDPILGRLRDGWDLVIGNRFSGGIAPGAMPVSHRYLGVPLLSWLGRLRFRVRISDFHCGLRGAARTATLEAGFQCSGMEFSTEMIGRFADAGFKICQVPVRLQKDLRQGPGHLRTIPDGIRHLKLILFWKHN
jgi:glycosyltransferase involved in cell wall biosynthesis